MISVIPIFFLLFKISLMPAGKPPSREILARLAGRSSELLSYDEVVEKLKLNVRTEAGVYDIPLKAIIGSVGRYNEFNRDFLPLKNDDQQRWRACQKRQLTIR